MCFADKRGRQASSTSNGTTSAPKRQRIETAVSRFRRSASTNQRTIREKLLVAAGVDATAFSD
jgi:hypothetical protein